MRFNKKFEYIIVIDEAIDIDYVKIPSMIIQPYIENAIWHGIMNLEDRNGILRINLIQFEDLIKCEIVDNGIGRAKASKYKASLDSHSKSLGMSISNERIQLLRKNKKYNKTVEIDDLYDENGKAMGTKITLYLTLY